MCGLSYTCSVSFNLFVSRSGCFVTQSAFLKVVVLLLTTEWSFAAQDLNSDVRDELIAQMFTLCTHVFAQSVEGVSCAPGRDEFYTLLAQHTLTLCEKCGAESGTVKECILTFLSSNYYQVTLV